MGLFTEKEKFIEENYVRVLDVLESLLEKSDDGWYEVGHFLKNSSIESITTYAHSFDVVPEVFIHDQVEIEHVYEEKYSMRCLKDALLAYIFNNCEDLDGNNLENKIIAEYGLTEKFKRFLWLKSDIKKLPEFAVLDIYETPNTKYLINKKAKNSLEDSIYKEDKKYKELIFCIEDFCEQYNQTINTFAKFLKQRKFYKHCDVYIRIGEGEFIKLNKLNSEKAIQFILDFLDNPKFKTTDLGFGTDFFELMHILINKDDLYYFPPLQDMHVDLKMGNTIYENLKFGSINQRRLGIATDYHLQETKKNSEEYWEFLKNIDSQELPSIDTPETDFKVHPSFDPNYPNYAPELRIAIEAWEAKYLHNEYPHQEHTPAITNILKNRNITQTNLVKRICAITNPKK